jgi:hypothetical protein
MGSDFYVQPAEEHELKTRPCAKASQGGGEKMVTVLAWPRVTVSIGGRVGPRLRPSAFDAHDLVRTEEFPLLRSPVPYLIRRRSR